MRKSIIGAMAALAVISLGCAAGVAFLLSAARPVVFEIPSGFVPNAERGRYVFTAAGCGSCHAGVDGGKSFGGGKAIASPFGPIFARNISPDHQFGIGAWSDQEFLNAIKRGVSPRASNYYPAFPYARYSGLSTSDLLDVRAYLETTRAVPAPAQKTALPPPFNIRLGLGFWKLINAPEPSTHEISPPKDPFGRGRYLVENAAHCQECHTPRTLTLGLDRRRAFAGAAGFDGTIAPPLTPQRLRKVGPEAFDQTLRFGLTLDGTGSIEAPPMLDVIENISMLTDADRRAIYHYLTEREASAQPPP